MNNMICMMKPTGGGKNAIDMVTLGERGQLVIPAAIRDRMSLQPGDKLMVYTKHSEVICIVPASSMRHLVEVLNAQLAEIEDDSETEPKQENK